MKEEFDKTVGRGSGLSGDQTMVNLGKGGLVEKPTTETELKKALEEARSFEEMEILVRDYNSMFDEKNRGGISAQDYAASVMPADYVLLRKEFDDCDAIVVQRNRVTELQKRKKMGAGDKVKVKRTSGKIEPDWEIAGLGSRGVLVVNGDLQKTISYSSLLEMNSSGAALY